MRIFNKEEIQLKTKQEIDNLKNKVEILGIVGEN